VERPDEVGPAWDRALAADRPVIFDAVVDPNITQLPPHITLEQAHNMFSAMAKGDPDRGHVIKDTFRSVMATILPSSHERPQR
jgi:pyruvate dehydrogenase (quinone)